MLAKAFGEIKHRIEGVDAAAIDPSGQLFGAKRSLLSIGDHSLERCYQVTSDTLHRVFEALYEYKRRQGCTGFDEALLSLLPSARRRAS